LAASIFHSINHRAQLLVGKVASDDCSVNCSDIHLRLLFAEHVCIIADLAILVNQKIVGFLQQNSGILGKKIREILLF